jgi:hypothetical protein
MPTDEAEEIRGALKALVLVVEQWGHIITDNEGELYLDSGCYSANAAAMRVLAEHGLLTIRNQVGRRVTAKWTEAAREFGADVDFSLFRRLQDKKQKGQPKGQKGSVTLKKYR